MINPKIFWSKSVEKSVLTVYHYKNILGGKPMILIYSAIETQEQESTTLYSTVEEPNLEFAT